MFFNQYPYLNLNDLNLDYVLKTLKSLSEQLENFISLNTIKYANPIQWNITTQYEANTVVIDANDGTAYLSVRPVPTGVAITNTDYWTPIFTLNLLSANQNITLRDDGSNTLATFTSDVDDWLISNGVLYKVIRAIAVNEAYVVGYNLTRYSVEHFIRDYIQNLMTIIGDLDDLPTTDKTSIVNALIELSTTLNNDITDIQNCLDDYLTPDMFTGTDGEKIQAAIDSLENTGGTIIFNRAYTLDRNILIKRRTTNPNHKEITLIGLGGDSEIDFGAYHFEGYDTNHVDYGGLRLINMKIHGTDKAFVTDHLIRITLDSCNVWAFDYVFYGTDYSQSIFILNSSIQRINVCVMYVLRYAWDTHINCNRIELCESVFNANVINAMSFTNNVVESYSSDTPLNRRQLVFRTTPRAVVISGNYFEDNECTIDLSDISNSNDNSITIADNVFMEASRNLNAICIKLPKTAVTKTSIMLTNNTFNLHDASQYAIAITETGHDMTNVVINNCHGTGFALYDPEYKLHDIANYNNDTYSNVVSMTDNVNVPPKFKRDGHVCLLKGIVTVNEAVSSGSNIIKIDDVRNAPNSNTNLMMYDASNMTPIQARISSSGYIETRSNLTSGSSYVLDFIWRCR